ncbi:MAG: HAMP domain-containing histidine kinase [Polyangiaceae bacterium]|nr:HAMP domain-containing histidine kinase [Polyangiaceae bacterium]
MKHRRFRGRRSNLRHRLFVLFGLCILATVAAVTLAYVLIGPGPMSYREAVSRVERYVGARLEEVWDEPTERTRLTEQAAQELGLGIVLLDATGQELSRHGADCPRTPYRVFIERDGVRLGEMRACTATRWRRGPGPFLFGVLVFAAALWLAAGWAARRMTRPLERLLATARAIGDGDTSVRTGLTRVADGELGGLGEAMDEMAERIARQMGDQRELLAVVSHEIRSPLTRLRVMLETLEERGASPDDLERMEREIRGLDGLVGELLASSRLEFALQDERTLDAGEVLRAAAERAGVEPSRVRVAQDVGQLRGDASLLARALDNLLDNARVHGGGVDSVSATRIEGAVLFAVQDRGPGFTEELEQTAFESFVRGSRSGGSSLGLGLSLVRRIAESHGGRAFVERPSAGGTRVCFSVRV